MSQDKDITVSRITITNKDAEMTVLNAIGKVCPKPNYHFHFEEERNKKHRTT